MENKKEMYEYLEWLIKKIKEDKTSLNWIGSEDCACEFINDTRTVEDIEKGCALVDLCNYIAGLDSSLSEKITKIYNILEETDSNFLSYPCVCFKYKNEYYFIRHLPYFGGDTHLSIIDEKDAKNYGFIEL